MEIRTNDHNDIDSRQPVPADHTDKLVVAEPGCNAERCGTNAQPGRVVQGVGSGPARRPLRSPRASDIRGRTLCSTGPPARENRLRSLAAELWHDAVDGAARRRPNNV